MSFKVLDYSFENDRIHVLTDYESRPEFVYDAGQFSSFEELEAEILRSIAFEEKRKAKKEGKKAKLSAGLVAKKVKP